MRRQKITFRYKYAALFLVLALIAPILFACGQGKGQTNEISANVGEKFSIAVGQSASIRGEELKIKFIEVVNDSRCPTGATCVWAGEASCLIEIIKSGTTYIKELTQPGSSSPSKTSFNDYEITFDIQPYPELGKETNKKDYRLQLVISKKTTLGGGILATFDVVGEKYSIFITNKETIEQVLAARRGESLATIPSGRLLKGSVPYNQPWSWHIDSEDIHMAEVTTELCDGTPSQVEANLDYWVDTVKRFCPWSVKIVMIEDFR